MSPTKALQRFKTWSYSRLDLYLTCPLRAKFKFHDKLPEPPAPPLERGTAIHKLAEDYLRGTRKKLPVELSNFELEFKALAKIRKHLQVECELAFDENWKPVDWFAPDCWARIKIDLMYDDQKDTSIRHVDDWKTGKVNPDHQAQLELYAIAGFLHAPKNITRIDARLAYLDVGEVVDQTFMRSDLPKLQKKWAKRAAPMLADTAYKPTPSAASCKWCPWKKEKGGPCKF